MQETQNTLHTWFIRKAGEHFEIKLVIQGGGQWGGMVF